MSILSSFIVLLLIKTLATIAALQTLRYLNRYLSKLAQNNWVKSVPWTPTNEIALITGGSSGIGRQIVHDLAGLGLKAVVIWDVKELEGELPPNVHFHKTNITYPSSIHDSAIALRTQHGHPTILINNAGIAYSNTLLSSSEDEIRGTMEVNTLSHFWTTREFLPAMLEKNHGHIVTMASMASFAASGGLTVYSASKAALLGIHEGVSQEVKHFYEFGDGVGSRCRVRTRYNLPALTLYLLLGTLAKHISIIHPLYVATPMTSVLIENKSQFRRPFMTAERVSAAVVKQIVSGNSGQVVVPESHGGVVLLRGLPGWLQEVVRDWASRGFLRLMREQQK
ncbi:hypothetical protein BDV06DRAFT_222351 [Aspergillus oleicola]